MLVKRAPEVPSIAVRRLKPTLVFAQAKKEAPKAKSLKEIKFGAAVESADLERKLGQALKHLEKGHPVKCSLQAKYREVRAKRRDLRNSATKPSNSGRPSIIWAAEPRPHVPQGPPSLDIRQT